MMAYYVSKVYRWLLPTYCALCRILTAGASLCTGCYQELPWLKTACVCCANKLSGQENLALLCGECLRKPPPYARTLALFYYQFPIEHLILSLKFQGKLCHAGLLGGLMAQKIMRDYQLVEKPELIIPVPLHPKRLKERGFNQALELARPIAAKLHVPLLVNTCSRIKETKPQATITAKERSVNLKKAFVVKVPKKVTYVAIVDDVVTTTSTVSEFSAALRAVGVERIDVWCCARTVL